MKRFILALPLILAGRLPASTYTWDGSFSNDWSSSLNWSGSLALPLTDDEMVFPTAGANKSMNNDLGVGVSINRLTFSGSGYTTNGDSISLSSTVGTPLLRITHSSGTTSINSPLSLAESSTFSTVAGGVLSTTFLGTVDTNGSTLTLDSAGTMTLLGTISDSGGVTLTGNGLVTYGGSQSYSGNTALNAGRLNVGSGATVSNTTITVAAAATLSGLGTVAAVNSSGHVSPNYTAIGRLTVSGNIVFNTVSTASLDLDLGESTTAAGTYDQLRCQSGVTIGTGSVLHINPTGTYAPSIGEVFTLLDKTSAGAISGTFSGLPENGTVDVGNHRLRISYIGGDGNDLTATVVNAPPTAANISAADTYIEDTPLNLTDIVVADLDGTSVYVTLTLSNPAAGSLNVGSSGSASSNYSYISGVWSASGQISDVNVLLAGLTFTPAADFDASFTITTNVSDFASSVSGSKTMTCMAVNDAPIAYNLSASEVYTEDTPLNLTDIVVSDIDSTNVTATLTLSNLAAGSLSTATSGAVTSTYNAATGVWSAAGAITNINVLLGGLSFTPAANFNGNFTISTSVSDGVAAALTGTKTMTGTAVNDAPTATNLSASEVYTEDTPLNLTDIVVSDIDSTNVTATLTLSNPAAGSLSTATSGAVTSTYNAATGVWSAAGAITNINVLLGGLSFTPAANFNGNFTISTSMSEGVAAALTGTKTMTGTAVNDAPTATNLSASEVYTEDTPLNLTDIVVSDIDSTTITATLALSNRSAGSFNTATSGAVTSTYNVTTGVWTASGAIGNVNTLLAGLTFTPAANFNGNFTISTSVNDGVEAALTGTKTMIGTAVNDAPTAINLSASEVYSEDVELYLIDIVVSDIDSTNVTATLTLSNPAAGSLSTATSGVVTSTYNAATGVWSASGAIGNVNTLLAGLSFTPAANFNGSFTIDTNVSDGEAVALTGSKAMTGIAINDAPTATNLSTSETYIEDSPLILVDIIVSDIDSASIIATLTLLNPAAGSLSTATSGSVTSTYNVTTGVWTASGAIGNVNTLLAGLTFTPAANFAGNFNINTSVSDGEAVALTGSKLMIGTSVNDAPTATNLSTPETYIEDTVRNFIDIVVADVDSTTVTATLTLSNPAAGSLSTATSGSVTSTYNAATGVWAASGVIANVNTLLAGLTFTPAANFNGSFSISTSVTDGVAVALTGTKAMTGIAVNDAPTATNLSASETYTEDTPLNLIDILVTDVDNANVTATLTLSNPAAGSLSTATSGSVTSTYNAGTGVWTAAGAVANVNVLLAGLTFTPAANFNGSFSISTSVTDGVASRLTGNKTMIGTAVDDAPTATNLSASEIYVEDTALNLFNIVVSDIDSATVTATLTLSNPAAGSLSTATSGPVTSIYDAVTGVWTAAGVIGNVNTLLADLTFIPSANFNENFSIATSVSNGGASATTGGKAMTGIAVNDAPTATNLSASEIYTEDIPLNLIDIVITDIDSASVTATLELSNPGAGSLGTATSGPVTSTYDAGTGVWTAAGSVANVNALLAGLTFTPAANASGIVLIFTSVTDGESSVLTGIKTVTGTAVNDAPSISTIPNQTIIQNLPPSASGFTVFDVETSAASLALTVSSSNSTLVPNANIVFGGGGANRTVSVTPVPNQIGTATITVTVSDGALTASSTFLLTVIATPATVPNPRFFPTDLLPSGNAVFSGLDGGLSASYTNGFVVVRNVKMKLFNLQGQAPLPVGQSWNQDYESQVEMEVSTDGGLTFIHVNAPLAALASVTHLADSATTRFFDTELLQWDIHGGNMPLGIMFRESPTLASSGRTAIEPVSGGFMMGGFFDVFTEISIDGGASWSPGSMSVHLKLSDIAPEVVETASDLPPTGDEYASLMAVDATFSSGFIFKDTRFDGFAQSFPPPSSGDSQTHTLDFQAHFNVSQDGGATFNPVSAPAQAVFSISSVMDVAATRYFNTEMLSLSIAGGSLPSGIMLRESPSKASQGRTSIRQLASSVMISDFFDVFVELSLDGGASWFPSSTGPIEMILRKLPPSLTAIESWRQLHFGTSSNSGNAANNFDFDHDGLVNLIEFAFGLNPTVPDAASMPQFQRVGNELVISFSSPPSVSGITYGAQSSETLAPGDWQAVPDTGTPPNHEFRVVNGTKPRDFVRITITGQAEELASP